MKMPWVEEQYALERRMLCEKHDYRWPLLAAPCPECIADDFMSCIPETDNPSSEQYSKEGYSYFDSRWRS